MTKFQCLLKEAEKMNIKVKLVDTVYGGANACFYLDSRVIHINKLYSHKKRLYFFAHELGHAHYSHSAQYLDQAIRDEKQADDYSEQLAIKFGFYSSSFKKYINGRREMWRSKEYRAWLINYGYIKRK